MFAFWSIRFSVGGVKNEKSELGESELYRNWRHFQWENERLSVSYSVLRNIILVRKRLSAIKLGYPELSF